MLPPLAAWAVIVTVESLTFEGVKNISFVMMFSDFPANMKFICWVLPSKSVRSILSSLSSKPLMMAFEMVPPLVSKVNSTFSFFSTICWLLPLSAEKKSAVESPWAAASACALRAASSAFCFLAAFSLMTAAMLSSLRWASICSADGWLYQLKPMRTSAINTNPIIVSLFIFLVFIFYFK